MDKEAILKQAERAVEKTELAYEKVFLFQFFNFEFSYDDEKRECAIECPVSEAMFNPLGTVHGGIFTYLADTAIGHLHSHFKEDPYVSLELKTTHMKAVTSGKLIAKAHFSKNGYNVTFAECDIFNEDGELVSTTSGTFYRVKKR
ncbi:PaaI family thioesterase [Alkalihalobacterium chitinilyticum]|uniref:PaaI family thioesterase n=1 Tax=Alkalihalobacterium chitinilyticum TaxID=2980103 RepID=A0ABT5VDK2_9BACI|nr:PaaI family thioesterase [Alkalihalobacterium chitinilyticum]MDE5413523.1 PaaI family thioesterase [Alkalihalobacterium chitinilyticum]